MLHLFGYLERGFAHFAIVSKQIPSRLIVARKNKARSVWIVVVLALLLFALFAVAEAYVISPISSLILSDGAFDSGQISNAVEKVSQRFWHAAQACAAAGSAAITLLTAIKWRVIRRFIFRD